MGKKGFFTVLLGTAAAAAVVSLRKKGEKSYHVEFDVEPSGLGRTAAQAKAELERTVGENAEGEADR